MHLATSPHSSEFQAQTTLYICIGILINPCASTINSQVETNNKYTYRGGLTLLQLQETKVAGAGEVGP
jgi:hypothetical protein